MSLERFDIKQKNNIYINYNNPINIPDYMLYILLKYNTLLYLFILINILIYININIDINYIFIYLINIIYLIKNKISLYFKLNSHKNDSFNMLILSYIFNYNNSNNEREIYHICYFLLENKKYEIFIKISNMNLNNKYLLNLLYKYNMDINNLSQALYFLIQDYTINNNKICLINIIKISIKLELIDLFNKYITILLQLNNNYLRALGLLDINTLIKKITNEIIECPLSFEDNNHTIELICGHKFGYYIILFFMNCKEKDYDIKCPMCSKSNDITDMYIFLKKNGCF